ncbi:MAG: glycosyltransferase family 4 protein [Lachnospiraceae bacterium]|nr:glycosyltransferase family 4 protein [Lachnospiraceae bacterium]
MRKVLVITGRYLPGYRDGGPVRSVLNLTQWLGDEYDFTILCHDRDHGDERPYDGIDPDGFNNVGKARVRYVRSFTAQIIESLAGSADIVYVCGLYDDYARIAMRLKKAGRIRVPVCLAPMGSFSPEAFRIKGFKKRLFVLYMKLSGMFDDLVFSVTSKREEEELKAVLGKDADCVIASDLPRQGTTEHTHIKETGSLRLCFISRIVKKKNLLTVPDILKLTDDNVHIKLDIYGEPEDKDYLHECMARLDDLRKTHPNCRWEYKGPADSEKVPGIFADYDAFLFPTRGENYGHVIAESLAAGCIPVISDTTPWLDLGEKGCGYVFPLKDIRAFADTLDLLVQMSEEEMSVIRDRCCEYIARVNEISVKDSGYRTLFEKNS